MLRSDVVFFCFLKVIEKESGDVEAASKIVREDEAVANAKAAESQALKDECESDLAEALPALEASLAALNTLKVIFLTHYFIQHLIDFFFARWHFYFTRINHKKNFKLSLLISLQILLLLNQ